MLNVVCSFICLFYIHLFIFLCYLFLMSLHKAEAYSGINLATASRSFPIELEKLTTLNREHDTVLLQEVGGVS